MLNSTLQMVNVRGHVEVYDSRGNFVCSGDTEDECIDQIEEAILEELAG